MRRFIISYYSEVSAEVKVFCHEMGGDPFVTIVTDHPHEIATVADWYHFCDINIESSKIAHDVSVDGDTRQSTLRALHEMAESLWPGPRIVLSDPKYGVGYDDETKQYEQFRQDFLYAFLCGKLCPGGWHQSIPEKYWIDEFRSEHWA